MEKTFVIATEIVSSHIANALSLDAELSWSAPALKHYVPFEFVH